MSRDADIKALMNILSYSEQEAERLGVSVVVVHCLRMATAELTNSAVASGQQSPKEADDNCLH